MPERGVGPLARGSCPVTMQRSATKTIEPPGGPAKRHGELPAGGADVLDPVLAIAATFKPLSRPPIRMTVGVLSAGASALAVAAFLGYQVYDMFSYFDIPLEKAPLSTAVSGRLKDRGGLDDLDNLGLDAVAGADSTAKARRGVAPPAVPAPTSDAVPGDAVRTPADPRRASRRAAPSASERVLPRAEPCTAAIVAVGLCSPGPGPEAKTETAAAAGPAIAPPQASVARKSGEVAQPRALPCTEGVAALGLCASESIKGKE